MITAFILMNVRRDAINETAQKLQGINGISEVYSVSGRYDLIAIARVPSSDDLAALVTSRMPILDAILATETMLAFKSYSRHDLEAMFSVGME
ncbi:Lrp/AsnC family transcriptional regulator [Desulfobulbus oralis]|uniref:AsnC family transcriptional regulator n=1 Tax=Desulfobulbus oralis TaxID=1986146 RepID=A0A2L1GMI3_9BACT|nr:Lrp/AsnC family transcriptional regulator [Desulfobulbus oralis]AVD70883.1 AsnC family transcriptional regulator [Desulfobulbus oralis]